MFNNSLNNTKSRILIVDDNLNNIQILGTILRKQNFAINIAQNGKEAIEILKKVQPDLILLDVMMPDMNGYETCQNIKKYPYTQNIPIIFLTALNNTEDKIKGFKAGGVDYITKPFDEAELLARINTHISLRKAKNRLKDSNSKLRKANKIIEEKNIQLERAVQKLESLAITDYLTGAYNRRYAYGKLKEMQDEYINNGTYFSIILGDIDYFKSFNDIYGHALGDNILITLVKLISENLRSSDFLVRWGGEEFMIILPSTTLESACNFTEKLKKIITRKTFIINKKEIRLSMTFGVSEMTNEASIDDLIDKTDSLLYKGKHQGRNCICH